MTLGFPFQNDEISFSEFRDEKREVDIERSKVKTHFELSLKENFCFLLYCIYQLIILQWKFMFFT